MKEFTDVDKAYDFLLEFEFATEEEIDIVCAINGYNMETMNDILYYKTAYHDFEQLCECEQGFGYAEYLEIADDEEEEEEEEE